VAESPEQPTALVVHGSQPSARVSNDLAVARLREFLDAFHAAREPTRVRALCGDLLNALTELLPGAAKAGLKIIQAIDRYASNASQEPSEIVEALQTAIEEPTREWMANEFEQVKSILDQSLVMLARLQPSSDVQRVAVLFEGPRCVPAKPVPFFRGRDDELADLEQLLLGNRTVCVVATGIGGIGKTTLAEEFVATRAPELFPDGVAWLDGRELISELGRVARRFGWADKREATATEALRLLGQRLHTQRFLLVVDNFDPSSGDPEHVPSPGGQCRTVVTSRSRPLAGRLVAVPLELRAWDLDACRGYLRERCPRLRTEADADVDGLAEFVGRLPLGVRLLVSVLDNRRSLGAVGVLKLLEQQPLGVLDKYEADRGVAATFQSSYEALTDEGKRVLRAIAVCAKHTRAEVVGAVAAERISEKRSMARRTWSRRRTMSGFVPDVLAQLDDLHARGLVEFVMEDGAQAPWGLHDVVRMFVLEQPGRRQFEAAHELWVGKHIEDHADPTAHKEFSRGVEEARVVFDRLVAHDPDRAATVYASLVEHLTVVGRYPEVVAMSESLLAAAAPNSKLSALAMSNLGNRYLAFGNIPKALEYHGDTLAIDEKLGDLNGQSVELAELGHCYFALGDMEKAIDLIGRSLYIKETLGHLEGQAMQLGNLGRCYRALGDIKKAIALYERSWAIHEKLKTSPRLQAVALLNLGDCYQLIGAPLKAIDFADRGLSLTEKIGNLEGQADAFNTLGKCYMGLDNPVKAITLLERGLLIFEKLDSLEGLGYTLANLALCHRKLGNVAKAMDLLKRALGIHQKRGDLANQAAVLAQLGNCFRSLGNDTEAVGLLERALSVHDDLGNLEGQAGVLANLGFMSMELGNSVKARDCLIRALTLFRRMGLPDQHPHVQMVADALAEVGGS